ncbi:MAG TPA: DPP IV N-terminal domain-containing protein [Vicinamibacterales bacterium]|nr:DPP IV N-terminal domain-containing protein [Vicinamibacterales bacterium]
MKPLIRVSLVLALVITAVPLAATYFGAPAMAPAATLAERELPKANYDLASRWTAAKVGKYVFSTSVTPHWLEFSDRFWYDYETPAGHRWWIVDPVKKTKTPLFDNAKMAAQLTRILRTPYDAQHLPISTVRFFENDTKFRFSVSLPRDAKVENAAGEELTGMTQTQDQGRGGGQGGGAGRGGGGGRGGQQGGRQGAPGGAAPVQNTTWWLEYDVATQTVVLNDKYKPETSGNPNWATVSPDKKYVLYSRNYNLFMMDAENFEKAKKNAADPSIVETQLTTDGERNYGFGRGGGAGNQDQQQDVQVDETTQQGGGRGNQQLSEADKKYGGPRTSAGGFAWSQDNRMASVTRTDQRKVADLWVINALANPRPTLQTYKYGMPGEDAQPQAELHVIDLEAKKALKVKTAAFKDQQMALATAPVTNLERERGAGPEYFENADNADQDTPQGGRGGGAGTVSRWVSTAGDKIYYNRTSRDLKRIDIVEADTKTGESRVVIPERSNTYIEIQPLRLINSGKQAIHWSERDGWGHYYLYDISGKLIRQVTSGEFVTTGITNVDEKSRTLYFTAVGREPNEDPYYQHFYSVNLDTGAMKLLDPGNASHSVQMNDKCTYFVDNSSRIDSAPESVLYDAAGNKVMELEKTDVSRLLEAGFKYPEAFTVKADDGITDLYGVMYKPFDFDPSKKYPVILYVYPGPQTESVTKTFNPRELNVALANVGFIVLEVGNRGGNPQRSKWYHNYGYGNLRDYGVPDKKAAVEQLAKRYPFVDLERVGIYGHSGGGFMTAAAMFGFPDFFKVGISESGNHDNSIYNRWWSEKHDGVKEVTAEDGKVTFQYDIDKNQDIASNLKGHLLLMTGDVDNNVHPSNTYRVMDALIRANKRFDFILLPGQPHSYGPMGDYVYWRRIDYFAEHLLGTPPSGIDIVELDRERQIRR